MIGATLLFWGAMTGRPLIGLLMALVAESSQWLKWRWAFDDAAIARAWQLAIMLSAGVLALLLIDGEREQLMPILVTWLPALLLPLHLAQMFGLQNSIPLSALSFFASRRRERNKRLGIEEPEIRFHFGNAYFVVILIASTLGVWAEARLFLPGLLVLCAWRFLGRPGRRAVAVVAVFMMAGLIAVLGQVTLNRVYDWFSRGGHGGSSWLSDATHGYTAIGSMRDMKLSSEIRWRIRTGDGRPPPMLMRRASFNRYRGTNWEITLDKPGSADDQFDDLDTIEPAVGEAYYLANPDLDAASATSAELRRIAMRGSTKPGGAMPLPSGVASFRDFDLDAAQRNPLSTIRVFPASPVINGLVLWETGRSPDGEPVPRDDLRVPPLEEEMLVRVAESIGLHPAMTTREKMGRIQAWFQRDFRYSLYLSMRQPTHSIREGTAIGRFLESTRTGHCEYFATAAALLLRTVAVPTRYTTGYALVERDDRRGEFIIRGIHSHAWCRVWLNEESRWVDYDPTPPDWQALEAISNITWTQRAVDALQRWREDVFIWRSDPENRELLLMLIIGPGILGGLWIGWRLWKSRHMSADSPTARHAAAGRPSPLFSLEPLARRHLGPRPDAMPFAEWFGGLDREFHRDADPIAEAIHIHQQLRFDPDGVPEQAIERLDQLTHDLRKEFNKPAAN